MRRLTSARVRLIDTAGSEIGIIDSAAANITVGAGVRLPDGRPAEVVEVYDDEFGREGGVRATLVVETAGDSSADALPEQDAGAFLDLADRLGLGAQLSEFERLARRLRDHVGEQADEQRSS